VPLERPQAPAPAEPTVPSVPAATTETTPVVPEEPAVPQPEAAAETEAPPVPQSEVIQSVLSEANAELATTGELSEDSRKKLAEATGLPQDFIEITYEGMRARQQRNNQELLSVVGGSEAYKEMVSWATEAYSADDATAFNDALKSGDLQSAKKAMEVLKAKFTAVNGSPKALIAKVNAGAANAVPSAQVAPPSTQSQPSARPFASVTEAAEAMKDKRYGRDTEYTREIYRRVHVSKF